MNQKISTNGELTFSAAILSAFLCALFGANAVAIKISLSGLGVFTTAGFRFSIAAAVIFLWAKVTRKSFAIKSGQGLQLLVFTLTFIVQLSLFYVGVSRTTASHATLLSNLLPFFRPLFYSGRANYQKENPGDTDGVCRCVCFISVEKRRKNRLSIRRFHNSYCRFYLGIQDCLHEKNY